MNLNDQVDLINRSLWRDDRYRNYLYAVYDEQAVEGSIHMDDAKASEMIREKAHALGLEEVARARLADILKALKVVLRRCGCSRKQRRENPSEADFTVASDGQTRAWRRALGG